MRVKFWLHYGGSKSLGVCIKMTTCNDMIVDNNVNIEYIYPKWFEVYIGKRLCQSLDTLNAIIL